MEHIKECFDKINLLNTQFKNEVNDICQQTEEECNQFFEQFTEALHGNLILDSKKKGACIAKSRASLKLIAVKPSIRRYYKSKKKASTGKQKKYVDPINAKPVKVPDSNNLDGKFNTNRTSEFPPRDLIPSPQVEQNKANSKVSSVSSIVSSERVFGTLSGKSDTFLSFANVANSTFITIRSGAPFNELNGNAASEKYSEKQSYHLLDKINLLNSESSQFYKKARSHESHLCKDSTSSDNKTSNDSTVIVKTFENQSSSCNLICRKLDKLHFQSLESSKFSNTICNDESAAHKITTTLDDTKSQSSNYQPGNNKNIFDEVDNTKSNNFPSSDVVKKDTTISKIEVATRTKPTRTKRVKKTYDEAVKQNLPIIDPNIMEITKNSDCTKVRSSDKENTVPIEVMEDQHCITRAMRSKMRGNKKSDTMVYESVCNDTTLVGSSLKKPLAADSNVLNTNGKRQKRYDKESIQHKKYRNQMNSNSNEDQLENKSASAMKISSHNKAKELKDISSYDITVAPEELTPLPAKSSNNYGLSDMDSDVSDHEDFPKKIIPEWATWSRVKEARTEQNQIPVDVIRNWMFCKGKKPSKNFFSIPSQK